MTPFNFHFIAFQQSNYCNFYSMILARLFVILIQIALFSRHIFPIHTSPREQSSSLSISLLMSEYHSNCKETELMADFRKRQLSCIAIFERIGWRAIDIESTHVNYLNRTFFLIASFSFLMLSSTYILMLTIWCAHSFGYFPV